MNSPLFINVRFTPLHGGDALTAVSAYGDRLGPVLGQGMREYNKAKAIFDQNEGDPDFAPFNATFVDPRRLQNLTPEQAAELEREYAITIKVGPGSQAPSMGE